MNKKLAISLIYALVICGCTVIDPLPEAKVFTATIEDGTSGESKTYLDTDGTVLWKQGDQVSIFAGITVNEQYQVTDASDGKTTASLYKTQEGFVSGNEIDNNVALYPYSSSAAIENSGSNYVISNIKLPATQYYAKDCFGNGAFPMAAVTGSTADMSLKFKNVLGGLKLQLKGTATISSIKITGNNNEILCGDANVTVSSESVPSISLTNSSSKTVTLNCGDGVALNAKTATSFIITLPPMTMSKGFKVVVTDSNSKTMEIKTTKSQTISRSGLLRMPEVTYEAAPDEPQYADLSSTASANCYIVSSAGAYKFKTVKGNSSTSVGSVTTAAVLWESFGTTTAPSKGAIIAKVSYSNNYICFETPATLKNGNAVIAAKNSSGKILWSWHIWVCSGYNPTSSAQTYYNNAGKMMDRNLGAISATPGNVGSLGLLYQWGRKDPFLGRGTISSNTQAASTLSWPTPVASNSTNGKVAYSLANPTTFILANDYNSDWSYTGSSSSDQTRWQSSKTIYDPCPAGWRVPDGYTSGVWAKASNHTTTDYFTFTYDSTNKGMNFKGKFGSATTIWYPSTAALGYTRGELDYSENAWWSCTDAYAFRIHSSGRVYTTHYTYKAYGLSVRCIKE